MINGTEHANGIAPPVRPAPKEKPLSVVGLVVQVLCSYKKVYAVALQGKQPRQVLGFLKHIQGGTLKIVSESATPAVKEEKPRIVVPFL